MGTKMESELEGLIRRCDEKIAAGKGHPPSWIDLLTDSGGLHPKLMTGEGPDYLVPKRSAVTIWMKSGKEFRLPAGCKVWDLDGIYFTCGFPDEEWSAAGPGNKTFIATSEIMILQSEIEGLCVEGRHEPPPPDTPPR